MKQTNGLRHDHVTVIGDGRVHAFEFLCSYFMSNSHLIVQHAEAEVKTCNLQYSFLLFEWYLP